MHSFWAHNFGWFLFVGVLFMGTVTGSVCGYFSSNSHKRRQQHQFRMQELRLRLEFAAKGVDPEYVEMLEKKVRTGD